jgi:hypothetical protein
LELDISDEEIKGVVAEDIKSKDDKISELEEKIKELSEKSNEKIVKEIDDKKVVEEEPKKEKEIIEEKKLSETDLYVLEDKKKALKEKFAEIVDDELMETYDSLSKLGVYEKILEKTFSKAQEKANANAEEKSKKERQKLIDQGLLKIVEDDPEKEKKKTALKQNVNKLKNFLS